MPDDSTGSRRSTAKRAGGTAGKATSARKKTATRKKPASSRKASASAARPAADEGPKGKAKAKSSAARKPGTRRGRSAIDGRPLEQPEPAAPAVEPARGARSTLPRSRRADAGSDPDRSGKYVYCIIQSTSATSFGTIGIGAEPMDVYTIAYKDIAAVVSDTPLEVYDPTRENVLSHEGVNERVMHEYTVIPMSFGTVFKTADDIVELLRSAYSAFRDVLQKMENQLEFGLKVLWDPDQILQVVEKEDEGLRRLREEILKQRGSTYFARMQYGRMVDSLLQEQSVYYQREIFDGLRAVSVASRSNKPIGERMIMNAAFLVSRDKEPEFDAAVKAIGSRYPHLTFKYTGPWPPYNFVNIRLKLERAEDAE
jgi:hypothetical protein